MELVAEASGRLGAIHVGAGSNANVAQIIGTLIVANEALAPRSRISSPRPVQDGASQAMVSTTPAATLPQGARSGGQRVFASPLARRLAWAGRLDLAALSGTGPRGRIVRNDVQRAMSECRQSLRDPSAPAPLKQPDFTGLGAHDHVPHSSIRSTVARRPLHAKTTPPQSCILAVGACEKRPVVRNNAIAIDDIISCKLSVDHRVLDGAIAAELLAAIRLAIEQPTRFLV